VTENIPPSGWGVGIMGDIRGFSIFSGYWEGVVPSFKESRRLTVFYRARNINRPFFDMFLIF